MAAAGETVSVAAASNVHFRHLSARDALTAIGRIASMSE